MILVKIDPDSNSSLHAGFSGAVRRVVAAAPVLVTKTLAAGLGRTACIKVNAKHYHNKVEVYCSMKCGTWMLDLDFGMFLHQVLVIISPDFTIGRQHQEKTRKACHAFPHALVDCHRSQLFE